MAKVYLILEDVDPATNPSPTSMLVLTQGTPEELENPTRAMRLTEELRLLFSPMTHLSRPATPKEAMH